MNHVAVLIGGLALLAGSGCATMIHRPLTEKDDTADRGVRYYGLSPYLLAYSNGKGGVTTEVRYLPDPAKKMSVRPEATLADVGSTMHFENGALTSAADTGDATAVTKAALSAVEKIGVALLGANAAKAAADDPVIPAPYIYRIVVKGEDIQLIGGDRTHSFKITLLPQPPPKKEPEQ